MDGLLFTLSRQANLLRTLLVDTQLYLVRTGPVDFKSKFELRTFFVVRCEADVSVEFVYNHFANHKPQSDTLCIFLRIFNGPEKLEQLRLVFLVNAHTCVFHRKLHFALQKFCLHMDFAVFVRKLQRV